MEKIRYMRMKNGIKISKSFSLIELLVSVAIIAILIAIFLPAISKARLQAKIVIAHSDLRQITLAARMYRYDNVEKLPPTRGSCNLRLAYELPVEFIPYMIKGKKQIADDFVIDKVAFKDPFTGEDYKYRAPGDMILNETIIMKNSANIWVQDEFPSGDCHKGHYYRNPKLSPVRYAVWSSGPVPDSKIFDIPGHLPVPFIYWIVSGKGEGVVTHFEDRYGQIYISR